MRDAFDDALYDPPSVRSRLDAELGALLKIPLCNRGRGIRHGKAIGREEYLIEEVERDLLEDFVVAILPVSSPVILRSERLVPARSRDRVPSLDRSKRRKGPLSRQKCRVVAQFTLDRQIRSYEALYRALAEDRRDGAARAS